MLSNLKAIIALDSNNGFAKNGNIPWSSKHDMNFFKEITINNTVIMGYNTLLSLPGEKPLKNRHNIVLTRNKEQYIHLYNNYNNITFMTLNELLNHITVNLDTIFFVIGGIEIISLMLPYISQLYVTRFKNSFDCDKFLNFNEIEYNRSIICDTDELTINLLSKSL